MPKKKTMGRSFCPSWSGARQTGVKECQSQAARSRRECALTISLDCDQLNVISQKKDLNVVIRHDQHKALHKH